MTNREFIQSTYAQAPEFMTKIMNYHMVKDTLDKPMTGNSRYWINETAMKFLSKGDKITVNCPDNSRIHGAECIIEKKGRGKVHVTINEKERWSIVGLNVIPSGKKEENLTVKIGDLVCIKTGSMRPGYSADALFKVVWKSAVNVRVQPINPKYPQEILSDYDVHWQTRTRPGSNVREYTDETRQRYFKKSVYQLDIPKFLLVGPDQYDKDDLELVMDLHDIGL